MTVKQIIEGTQERIELGLEYLEVKKVRAATEQINDAMREIERLKLQLGYMEE